jgi:hypothetical protein
MHLEINPLQKSLSAELLKDFFLNYNKALKFC